jgi:translation initiation factor 1
MSGKNKTKLDLTAPSGPLQDPFADLTGLDLPEAAQPEATPSVALPKEVPIRAGKRGRVLLRRETAHRGGKTVVVVYDIPVSCDREEIETLARDLRKHCGCGGTVREREIEIQGDQPGKIRTFLESVGFRVAGVRSA